jgi:hypothetical protein
MASLRLILGLLILTGLILVGVSNINTAVAINLLGFTSRSLPLSVWMLLAMGLGLGLSVFFEGLFALASWQPRSPRGSRDPNPGPRPRGGYAEDDEFIEENFRVPDRPDRYSTDRDPYDREEEAPWDDPAWVEPDRGYRDRDYRASGNDFGDNFGDDASDDASDDRIYDKRAYNRKAYGASAYDSANDPRYDDRTEDGYQAPPFKAEPKSRSVDPSRERPVAPRDENRVYDADFRVLDDNNPRPEPLRRAREEPEPPRSSQRYESPSTNRKADDRKPDDRNDWGDWNDEDLDW